MSWSCFSKKSIETEVKIISDAVTASVSTLDPNALKDVVSNSANSAIATAKAAAATLEATPVGAAAAATVAEFEAVAKPANILAWLRNLFAGLRKQIPLTDEKLASVTAQLSSVAASAPAAVASAAKDVAAAVASVAKDAPAPVAALVSAVEVPASVVALAESAELQIRSIAQAETAKVIESSKAAAAGIEQALEKATLASAGEPPKIQTE